MTKRFDEKRDERVESDREFVIHGERFVRRPGIRPEALLEYEDMDENTPAREVLAIMDGLIVALIEPGDDAAERWHAIRQDELNPVTLEDMQAVVEWLTEGVAGRSPTRPSSPSTPGVASTGTRSTEGSSSPGENVALPT